MSLVNTIRNLKQYGMVGIKTSFEDEGASKKTVQRLRTVSAKERVNLILKVGGCEARTDIQEGIQIGVDGIVGPMVESKFACEKFIDCVSGSVGFTKGINIETITAVNNLDDILSVKNLNTLDYMCIGRVDLISSMGRSRDSIDDQDMNIIVANALKKIKERGLKTYMGGAITNETRDFIESLLYKKLLNAFETRYIIFEPNDTLLANFSDVIHLSNLFEFNLLEEQADEAQGEYLSKTRRMKMIRGRMN